MYPLGADSAIALNDNVDTLESQKARGLKQLRIFLKLLASASLGLVVVLALVIISPEPSYSRLPFSGFLPEGAVEPLTPEQASQQFLFANLDAQQSAIAEARLLGEVRAEFAAFVDGLEGDEARRESVAELVLQGFRELTDYRLAQSMGVLSERQESYARSPNYLLARVAPLLTESERADFQVQQEDNEWEKFEQSFQARLAAFLNEAHLTLSAEGQEVLVRLQFEHSFRREHPHGLSGKPLSERFAVQEEAFRETRDVLAEQLTGDELRSAIGFIDAELAALQMASSFDR